MREMKDSGVEWLGEVPSRWKLHRAKRVFKLTNDRGNDDLTLLAATQTYGMWPQDRLEGVVRVKDGADLSRFRTVHKNDFVISLRSFQGGFERSDFEGVCSPAYQTFHSIKPINYQFFKYLFKSPSFIDHMNSLTLGIREGKTIKFEDFAAQVLPMPFLDEQRRIADYLDVNCAEIDRAISAAEQSVEEYKAYKNSVVNQIITKGLNSDVLMKDSGVEWLGEVPEGWRITPIKHLFYISKTIAGRTGFDVLSITQQGLKVKDIKSGEGQLASDYSHYQIVEPGDFAMNHMDLLTGWVDLSDKTGVTSPDYRVFKARTDCIDKRYFLRVFQVYYSARVFYGFCKGVSSKGRWRLPAEAFRAIQVPVPPFPEQHRIADYLDEKCAQLDHAIAAKQAVIADLKTYKQSLIYETVTGKREV